MIDEIKIPKNQISWVKYLNNGKVTHVVTSTLARDKYFLYSVNENGVLKKIKTSTRPLFKEFNLLNGDD